MGHTRPSIPSDAVSYLPVSSGYDPRRPPREGAASGCLGARAVTPFPFLPGPAERIDAVMLRVRDILSANPACHDWDHTQRVLQNARQIAEREGADLLVVQYAAVLHDIGRAAELADEGATCHAARGAAMTRQLLPELGVTEGQFVEHVAQCVATHRYRRRDKARPQTLEARIIFDADKLDCIGAIGIGRSFHFAGRIGARVHNREDEALGSESYSREDTAYREYLVKLRDVHNAMLTKTGRDMAESRHRFMVAFFRQLNCECAGEDLD